MRREAVLSHLLRALTGKTQEAVAKDIGVHASLIGHFERGRVVPDRDQLERLAAGAGITVNEAEEILRLYEGFRRARSARGRSADELLDGMAQSARAHAGAVYRRVLRLPRPPVMPRPGDRERAEVLWGRLKSLPPETRLGVVGVAEEFQSWALCERVCAESVAEASRQVERSAGLARLAQEIAERVPGPEGWRDRLRGYARAHAANVLRVAGDLKASEAAFETAKRLWHGGADPAAMLDPGRLPDLEASLRRAQRRFGEALALLDEALALGRSPARVLVKKGFTLEVMEEYERSIETLLQAKPLVESQGDQRLTYMLWFNLALNYCHAGRYGEATGLLDQVREVATTLEDDIFLIRVVWLEGRIAAGLGRPAEARALLGQARREFAARKMGYDVALALLEEAALLLGESRLTETKTLGRELAAVFNSQGVHREALAALRLFQKATEREEATAELARRILRFLYRAQYDQGFRFES